TPSVDASGSTVKVDDSTPISVRDSLNRVPAFGHAFGTLNPGQAYMSINLYTVPAGKQLEVKDAYFAAYGLSGQSVQEVQIGSDALQVFLPMPIHASTADSANTIRIDGGIYGSSMILPAGATLRVGIRRDDSTNQLGASVGFDGYLEDAS